MVDLLIWLKYHFKVICVILIKLYNILKKSILWYKAEEY